MIFRLHKFSLPDDWTHDHATMSGAIDDLRKHICDDCLAGSPGDLNDVIDIEFEGRTIECRDHELLLSTPCGVEFDIEKIEESVE